MKHKVSKGAMDELFKVKPPDGETSRIGNAEEMFRTLESIPYGIPNDSWKRETITGPETYNGVARIEYTVHYRDIMRVIQFSDTSHLSGISPTHLSGTGLKKAKGYITI
jgi:hypothetical protein